jgi:hypothetical protein
MVSRMMPGPAGRRWLAEAESVLWEITAARRSAAVRSYLLSGPRVAAVMWACACLRRVRRGAARAILDGGLRLHRVIQHDFQLLQ